MLVLLVDDDTWLADQAARYIRRELACEVLCASNGVEAMEILDEQRPDVIVLDLFMPGPNGLVLLHELQSHHDLASIPVVLCSNNASAVTLDELAAYGVVNLLDKGTMHPEDLVGALRKALV